MERREKYNCVDRTSMPHPGLGDGALVERADRSRRSDRDSPNERSVAQMRAELWPETRFHPNGALVERAGRSRRSDRDSPTEREVCSSNESRVMARNVIGVDAHPKCQGCIHLFL